MNKLIKPASFLFALLTMLFQPIQLTQSIDNCCAACAMKKEEDEIELFHEDLDDIEE